MSDKAISIAELNELREALHSDMELVAQKAAEKALAACADRCEIRIGKLEHDVRALQRDKWKAMIGWGVVAFVGTLAGPVVARWFKMKMGL